MQIVCNKENLHRKSYWVKPGLPPTGQLALVWDGENSSGPGGNYAQGESSLSLEALYSSKGDVEGVGPEWEILVTGCFFRKTKARTANNFLLFCPTSQGVGSSWEYTCLPMSLLTVVQRVLTLSTLWDERKSISLPPLPPPAPVFSQFGRTRCLHREFTMWLPSGHTDEG